MSEEDAAVREQLVRDGTLADDYHPAMERVHLRNGARLSEILDAHGWPAASMVGVDAAEAAWIVLQHAISMPELQRRGLVLLHAAVERGDAPPPHAAMLDDRIRVLEGREQRYGTQLDWDEDGELSPHPVEDPDGVDARRHAVGLEPLADAVRRHRAAAARNGERPPSDPAAKRRRREQWLRAVGWRS